MKINTATKATYTHEGAKAKKITPLLELRRAVMSCLLWEDTFYESGESIADRIARLSHNVSISQLANLAIEARSTMNLRHVPLLLVREMSRHSGRLSAPGIVGNTLATVIQRPDEITEFLAIYWKDGRVPLSAQIKKGLSAAFNKFSEYQFAKYNRDSEIKLRDALFLCHAKPRHAEFAELFKRIANDTLATPQTWEVMLSSGADKRTSWETLLNEKQLGALAFLRNLSNMAKVGVNRKLIADYAQSVDTSKVLPYRYIAAARAVPSFEPMLEYMMLRGEYEKLDGDTVLLVDVSVSMNGQLSGKSDMTRIDAACGLAILLREMTDSLRVYTFSNNLVEVPARRGFALRDAITNSQEHSGTRLGAAVKQALTENPNSRIIVISDEQTSDTVQDPTNEKAYMINVASYRNGVGYGKWNHVDGFSESVVRWIQEFEK